MRTFLTALIGIIAFTFSGCEQIENLENTAPPKTDETVGISSGELVLSAGFNDGSGPDSKVTFGNQYTNGGQTYRTLSWKEEGEKITVFFINKDYKVIGTETFTQISIDDTGKKAEFKGEVKVTEGETATQFLAVYPALKEGDTWQSFTFDLSNQTGNYEDAQHIMRTGSLVPIVSGEKETIEFKPWVFIIDATLTFPAGTTGTVTDLKFESPNIVIGRTLKVYDSTTLKSHAGNGSTPWGEVEKVTAKGDSVNGDIIISENHKLDGNTVKLKIYGFGDCKVQGMITCKVGGKSYYGNLGTRLGTGMPNEDCTEYGFSKDSDSTIECTNNHVYNAVINMEGYSGFDVIEFDFTKNPNSNHNGTKYDWPTTMINTEKDETYKDTEDLDDTRIEEVLCKYKVSEEVMYDFTLSDCIDADNARIFYDTENYCINMAAEQRFLGLPPLTNKKIVKIKLHTLSATDTGAGSVVITNQRKKHQTGANKYTYHLMDGGRRIVTPWTDIETLEVHTNPKNIYFYINGAKYKDSNVYIMDWGYSVWIDRITLTYAIKP